MHEVDHSTSRILYIDCYIMPDSYTIITLQVTNSIIILVANYQSSTATLIELHVTLVKCALSYCYTAAFPVYLHGNSTFF